MEMPVARLERLLGAYSTQVRCRLHEVGLDSTTQHRADSRSWLALLVWPLFWGWKPEVKLTVAPLDLQKALHTWEINWGPRSETMSVGISLIWTTCSIIVQQFQKLRAT